MSRVTGGQTIIGHRFQIDDLQRDLLGRGGMGDVYRGRDLQTGQAVAVKALRPEVVSGDPNALARFSREGEALRQLNHPNIVQMVGAVEQDGRHYLVMEYVPGGSLRDLLDKTSRPDRSKPDLSGLPIERTVEIALDVADALTRAHRLGILHRDLKPSNVLLAEDGTPRLTDFGHAHLATGPRLTQTGTVVGTVFYLSPEACRGETLDARADIWAFGVMLYEMLSGQVPFPGDTFPAVFMAILGQPVPDLSQACPEVPDALADLVYRMLEKDRAQRIPSVRQVGLELEAISEGYEADLRSVQVGVRSGPGIQPQVGLGRPSITESRFATPTPTATETPKQNLPVQPTPFVGREAELVELDRLLSDPDVRLVTVLGVGGMGKTRLALQAAEQQVDRFRNGAFFVSLAPLQSTEAIVPAIASALRFQFYEGGPPRQQLLDYLCEKRLLLLLDNYEHLLDGADIVADILATARHVRILVTSRARLSVQGEQLFHLGGMDYPEPMTQASHEMPEAAADRSGRTEYGAVKLFLQSARRVRPGFELEADDLQYIARICHLVGGMPLGVLLAAAWVEMLAPREIADEIGRSLDFLETNLRDMPERQRSMRAVFDHSWNLLAEREQEVFQALSVFRGGFTREAAQYVTGASLRELMSLVSRSLLHRAPAGRYEVHELLRQYAEARLDRLPGQKDRLRDLHCAYYAELLKQNFTDIAGGEQQAVLADKDNVRRAWRWAVRHGKAAEIRKSFDSLLRLCEIQGWFHEAQELYGQMARAFHMDEPAGEQGIALGIALFGQAFFSRQFSPQERELLYEESLSIFRKLGARYESAVVGNVVALSKPEPEGKRLLHESLATFREIGYLGGVAWTFDVLGMLALRHGAYQEAEKYCRQALQMHREIGLRANESMSLYFLGGIAHVQREYTKAVRLYEEGLAVAQAIGFQLRVGLFLKRLGDATLAAGEHRRAEECYRRALDHFQEIGLTGDVADSLGKLGNVALAMSDHARAEGYYRQALAMAKDSRDIALKARILTAIATLLSRKTEVASPQERAVELAALVLHCPVASEATSFEIEDPKERAQGLLVELEAELAPAAFQSALERGRVRDLWATLEELLEELEE